MSHYHVEDCYDELSGIERIGTDPARVQPITCLRYLGQVAGRRQKRGRLEINAS